MKKSGNEKYLAVLQVLWPPIAPTKGPADSSSTWWIAICIATVIPTVAVLHHLIFYRPTCLLNPFGPDYYLPVIAAWLSRDPSLPWAIVAMVCTYFIGNTIFWVRVLVAPVFLSFLPLSIWIWDIPFSGRFICTHFHDGRVVLAQGFHLTTRYFYALGLVLYLGFIAYNIFRRIKSD